MASFETNIGTILPESGGFSSMSSNNIDTPAVAGTADHWQLLLTNQGLPNVSAAYSTYYSTFLPLPEHLLQAVCVQVMSRGSTT